MSKRVRARLEKENKSMNRRLVIFVILIVVAFATQNIITVALPLLSFIEFVIWTKRK